MAGIPASYPGAMLFISWLGIDILTDVCCGLLHFSRRSALKQVEVASYLIIHK
jgi:hypothetical protein